MSLNRNTQTNLNTGETIFDYQSTLVLPDTAGTIFPLGVDPFVAQMLGVVGGPGPGGYTDTHVTPNIGVGGAAGTENDATFVSPTPAQGVPFCTITLPPVPGAGDEYTLADPFGQLAVGTVLRIDGNGNFIANGAAATATITLSTAGECRRLIFTDAVQSGGAINVGTWLVINR